MIAHIVVTCDLSSTVLFASVGALGGIGAFRIAIFAVLLLLHRRLFGVSPLPM